MHLCECVAPLVANSLQSGRFWAKLTASVHVSLWDSRSFWTVFIHVIQGCLRGLQSTVGDEVRICLASMLSSIRAMCPNKVKRHAWMISLSAGELAVRCTSSGVKVIPKWCYIRRPISGKISTEAKIQGPWLAPYNSIRNESFWDLSF